MGVVPPVDGLVPADGIEVGYVGLYVVMSIPFMLDSIAL
jgi:hypothetical protein